MLKKKLSNSDLNVSAICLGTMTFGEQTDEKEAFKILNYSFDKEINFFDTAEMYPVYPKKKTQGKSEEILGNWISESKNREKIVIATKVSSANKAGIGKTKLSWLRGGKKNLNYQKKNIYQAVNSSLVRLKTDYIDLYQLHFPEREVPMYGKLDYEFDVNEEKWTPILEVIENLSSLIKNGKIRYYGLSNESPWGIMKFINLCEKHNLPKPISTQNAYNLINRAYDIASSEISMREDLNLLAYSPLAGGRLTGKYLNGSRPKNARYTLWPGRFSRHLNPRGEKAIKRYYQLSTKHDLSLANMANAFVMSRPFVGSVIIGVTSVEQIEKNLSFLDIKLNKKIINDINSIHYLDPSPCI